MTWMMWAYLTPEMIEQMRIQADAEENKIIVVKKITDKCYGCGKFISKDESNEITFQTPYGPVHMVEACLLNMVKNFRARHKEWNWNNGPQGGVAEGFQAVLEYLEEKKLRK